MTVKIRRECGNVTPMAEGQLIMLGVIHRDEDGPALLKDWLARIKPDVITLELSHYGIRFRRQRGEEYKRRVVEIVTQLNENGEKYNEEALASILSYVDIPYEYDVVSAYASENETPFYLIDMDFFSYVKLRAIEDLFSEENIEKVLTRTDEGLNGNQEMTMASLYFEKGLRIAQYDREMYIRDRYMTAKIQDLMKGNHDRRFLHVCGWQHLHDPSGLYSPFNPTKVFSHDKALRHVTPNHVKLNTVFNQGFFS
jgi:hypothetical protein